MTRSTLFALLLSTTILMIISACAPAQQVLVVTATPAPMQQYDGAEPWPTYAEPGRQAIAYRNTAAVLEWEATQVAAEHHATVAALEESRARARALNAEATRIASDTSMTATQWAADSMARFMQLTQQYRESVAQSTERASDAEQAAATAKAAIAQTTQMAIDTDKAQAQADAEIAATERADQLGQLAFEQEKVLQPFRAFAPLFFFMVSFTVAILGGVFAFTRFLRVWELKNSIIRRDERGDAPVLVLPRSRGGLVIADPDRFFGPAMQISPADAAELVSAPELVPADFQDRTTARDQAVDLHTRTAQQSPVKPSHEMPDDFIVKDTYTPPPDPTPPVPVQIRITSADQIRPWIDEVQEQLALTSIEDAYYDGP